MQFRIIILILGLFPFSVFADETPVLARTGKTFNASIPTIKSVLGHDFGEAITRHKDMERYLEALASSASDRMKYVPIGKTFEGRSLYYVIISSAENMSRFEDFRKANLQLSDPRNLSPSQAQSIIENHPVFVGLSYSVHGNEHSGVEAGLAMMYYLLSADDEETKNILKNCIVIIDPMQNPDGRERFINYFYSTSGKNPNLDLNSAEHNEGWPSGRTNHYLFDMNRDWTVLSQAESRARVLAYRQYQPQIYIDVHEMGSNTSYFFPPPTVPQNPNIPKSLPGWWNTLGKAIAADFDKHGIDYFTQEGFDFWYPGYGDSWTTYNGALTGTFEQASVRGLAVKREDGIVLHYQDAIWHHFLSSLATCKMASVNRKEKLKDFYDYRLTAVQEGKTGPIKEFIIRRSNDPAQADRAIQNLLMHGIEVKQASADFRAGANGYYSERSEPQNFLAGDYIIPMDQPLKRLIQVMIEKESQFEKKFLEEEAKRREADEPSELYDITAWSMPLAMGLDAYWSGAINSVNKTDVVEVRKQTHPVAASNYAYVLNYKSNEDIATVLELLNHGIRVHFSAKPFTLAGTSYNAGSFIIKVKGNIEDLTETLSEIAQSTGAEFIPATTGWTEQGPDFGSRDVSLLRKPRVAVLMNIPTDSYSYGEINYLLDQRYYLQFTPIQAFYFNSINMKDYDVVVLPDSSGILGGYKGVLGSKGITKLKNWIEGGGTLIAIQGAAAFIADDGELTEVKRIKKFVKDSIEEAEEKEEKEEDEPAKEDQKTESPDYVIGSIARVELNLKEFLTFGYSRAETPVFVNSSNVFSVPHDLKPAASYAAFDRFKMAGLFWDITKKRLEKKAYATRESMGEGHVILFAENPNFRAAWESLNKLFMNGILFGPSM